MSKKTIEAWVARDDDGSLYMYTAKPKKRSYNWYAPKVGYVKLDDSLFPEVQWSDEEPTEVTITINVDEEQWKTRTFHSAAAGRAITACLTLE